MRNVGGCSRPCFYTQGMGQSQTSEEMNGSFGPEQRRALIGKMLLTKTRYRAQKRHEIERA